MTEAILTPREKTKTPARIFFISAVCLGVAGMSLGVWLDQSWLMISTPILAMLGYVVGSLYYDRDLQYIQSFADSAYFMGFLFTLVSLIISLVAFVNEGGEPDVKRIIAGFAVAIITTVVGLLVRILLVNFSPSVQESEAKAELSLARSSEELSRQMDRLSQSTVGRISAFNEAMDEILGKTLQSVDEATNSYRQGMSGFVDEFRAAGRETGATITEAGKEAADGFRRAEEGFQDALAKMREPQAELLRNLQEPMGAARLAMEGHREQILSLVEKQRELEEAISGLTRGVGDLGEAAQSMGSAATEIQQLEKDVELARTVIQRLEGASTGLEKALTGSVQALEQHNETMQRLAATSRDEAASLSDLRQGLLAEVEEASASLEKMHRHLVEAADYVRKSLSGRA